MLQSDTNGLASQSIRVVRRKHPTAFTLIELLVVIGIMAVLLALVLASVQAARDAARRVSCQNHLKQLAAASHVHHDHIGHLPTNGWGHAWVGDPDRGFGRGQPGGWVYNVLPFTEQSAVREIGLGELAQQKRNSLARLLQSASDVFVCPGRRAAQLHPYSAPVQLYNVDTPDQTAKTDYAINAGHFYVRAGPGPPSMLPHDLQNYSWPDTSGITGVSFVGSEIRFGDIQDGMSNTYLLGEKYINLDNQGGDGGDDQAMFVGDDADIRRWTVSVPLPDYSRVSSREVFGSIHSGACFFVFCDGSVRSMTYTVDLHVHRALGNRQDGQTGLLQ